jgi:hypothetical protein
MSSRTPTGTDRSSSSAVLTARGLGYTGLPQGRELPILAVRGDPVSGIRHSRNLLINLATGLG